ncbi:MAG: MBL fold metallo-hydrolase, partial [Lachnospiraceae bacterium]|nr:MBL fold metallo-hydrolase [Lachnospiraceae bacterium]
MAKKAKAEQSAGRKKQTAPKQKEQNQNKKKTTAAKQTAANKKQPVKKQESAKKKQTAVNKKQSAAVKTKQLSDSLKVIPLGGLEQIGMNMTAIEYNGKIVVIDCGMAFADDTLLGIDLIIPDITYLKQNKSKVKAFFITHGHEDHIGAIPYILKEINVPIYGTKLTIALIRKKLEETKLLDSVKLKVVDYGQKFYVSDFKVEFIRTNHSISDAAAIAIRTPAGLI